ncbi:hypothetical protein HQ590_01440, partial [bacterium]|nr:hypothetical protein [bacterium]
DLAAAAGLRFTEDHPWWARYRRHLDAFVTAGRGKFGVSHLILINGLNFVFELVGAMQTYIELLERPDLVRQALALSFTVNRRVQEAFFEQVPLVGGGTCSFQCHWLPGRVLCESVDPFHMTSVDYFEQWGREPLERAFDCFDGGVTHLHGNGRHLLEAVATVRGLKALSLGDDRGYPSAFDLLPELRRRAGDLPLTGGVPYPDFAAALAAQRLTGGVLYDVTDVPDADTANRCMEAVRAYRAG